MIIKLILNQESTKTFKIPEILPNKKEHKNLYKSVEKVNY